MAEFEENGEKKLKEDLARKAVMLKMRQDRHWSTHFGLIAALGGVIILPIILGILGGTYLDNRFPITFSWRLSLTFCGFFWGMVNAYFWIKIENEKITASEKELQEKINREVK